MGVKGGLGVEGGLRGGRGGLGVGGRGGVGGGSQGWVGGLAWYSGIQGMLLPREHLPSLYNNTRLPRIPGARRFCKECHRETFSYENMSFGSCMNLTSSEKVSVALGELKSFGGKLPPPPPPPPPTPPPLDRTLRHHDQSHSPVVHVCGVILFHCRIRICSESWDLLYCCPSSQTSILSPNIRLFSLEKVPCLTENSYFNYFVLLLGSVRLAPMGVGGGGARGEVQPAHTYYMKPHYWKVQRQ